jgi:hypothetical protein
VVAAVIFATAFIAAAVYEYVAIATKRVPTITAVVKALPLVLRLGVVALGVASIVDHFLLGVVL